jgi:hypothetical protein
MDTNFFLTLVVLLIIVASLVVAYCLDRKWWPKDLAMFGATVAGVVSVLAYTSVARQQLYETQQDSHAQLRAYVLLNKLKVERDELSGSVKNTGQTPAYDVTTSCSSNFRDSGTLRPTDFRFDVTRSGTVDIGGLGDEREIIGCRQEAGADNTKTLYAWGLIDYRDIYRHCHYAAFVACRPSAGDGPMTTIWHSADQRKCRADDIKADWAGPDDKQILSCPVR